MVNYFITLFAIWRFSPQNELKLYTKHAVPKETLLLILPRWGKLTAVSVDVPMFRCSGPQSSCYKLLCWLIPVVWLLNMFYTQILHFMIDGYTWGQQGMMGWWIWIWFVVHIHMWFQVKMPSNCFTYVITLGLNFIKLDWLTDWPTDWPYCPRCNRGRQLAPCLEPLGPQRERRSSQTYKHDS